MDEEQFNGLAEKTKLHERALRMAKDVLVSGVRPVEAGKKENVTRQLAEQATNRILRQLRIEGRYPENWITVTTVLPQGMAEVVNYIKSREREKAGIVIAEKARPPRITADEIEILAELIAGRKT